MIKKLDIVLCILIAMFFVGNLSALEFKRLTTCKELQEVCDDWKKFNFTTNNALVTGWKHILNGICTLIVPQKEEVGKEFWVSYDPEEKDRIQSILVGSIRPGFETIKPSFHIAFLNTAPHNLNIPENQGKRKGGMAAALVHYLADHISNNKNYKDVERITLTPAFESEKAYEKMGFKWEMFLMELSLKMR